MIDFEETSYAIAGFIGGVFAVVRAIRKKINKRWYDHVMDVFFAVVLGYVLSLLFIYKIELEPQLEYMLTALISSQSHYIFSSIENLMKKVFGEWFEMIVQGHLEKRFDVQLDKKSEEKDKPETHTRNDEIL